MAKIKLYAANSEIAQAPRDINSGGTRLMKITLEILENMGEHHKSLQNTLVRRENARYDKQQRVNSLKIEIS